MRHRRTPRTTPATNDSPLRLPAIALLIVSSCVDVAWGNPGCFLIVDTEADEEEGTPASGSWFTAIPVAESSSRCLG